MAVPWCNASTVNWFYVERCSEYFSIGVPSNKGIQKR